MVPDFQENVGGPAFVVEQSLELQQRAGFPAKVLEEKYVTRNGKPQFWYTAEFTDFEEPVQIRFVIEPDGRISGVGMNPLSQAPPTDN